MSANLATLISLATNTSLFVFASALVLLVLWQDIRRRSNQYFALCMVVFALYGLTAMAFTVARFFDLSPEALLNTLTTLYITGVTLTFGFVFSFAGLPRHIRRNGRLFSIPVGVLFIALTWGGALYDHFRPAASGRYHYDLTPVGLLGAALVVGYWLLAIGVLRRRRPPYAVELALSIGMLVLGMLGFSVTPNLRQYSLNTLAMTIAVVMLGRLVIKQQVFQPLTDLNRTLMQRNEELREATARKAQFLANMSHELRTPLNSIIGYTELIVGGTYGDLTALQHDRLHKVIRNGRQLLEVINDVLDISKIEAGRMALDVRRVPVIALLDDLLDTYEAHARERGITVVRGYGALPDLLVDPDRVRQILDDLLSNAVTFTERGNIVVRGYVDGTRQQVVLSVTDTGPGIEPAHQARIHRAFRHLDGTLKQRPEGTGLGLALAHRLAEMHGGNLWFESTVGQGSTFYVALPAAIETESCTQTMKPRQRSTDPAILVIDDDRSTIEMLQDYLTRAHYQVYGARDGGTGLQLAHALKPCLITLDLTLPDMPGERVLAALRSDPETAHIPVLIVTARDREDGDGLPADGFLTKPVTAERMLAEVHRLTPTGHRMMRRGR